MKKIIAAALSLVLMLGLLAGCGAKEAAPETTAPQATMPNVDLMGLTELIYEKHAPVDLSLVNNTLDLANMDLVTANTGLTSVDKVSEIVVSETMMGQPYSLVLVKAKDAADAAEIAQEMFDNIDQRKWICMEADTKTAAYAGDVAMFFMVSSDFSDVATTESMMTAFKDAVGVAVTEIG